MWGLSVPVSKKRHISFPVEPVQKAETFNVLNWRKISPHGLIETPVTDSFEKRSCSNFNLSSNMQVSFILRSILSSPDEELKNKSSLPIKILSCLVILNGH